MPDSLLGKVVVFYGLVLSLFATWYIYKHSKHSREQTEADKSKPVLLTFEFGRTTMARDAFDALHEGSLVELDNANGSGYRVYANNSLIAEGNLVSGPNGFRAVRLGPPIDITQQQAS